MITCSNCGQSVREGQRFCGACGAEVTATPSTSSGPSFGAAPSGGTAPAGGYYGQPYQNAQQYPQSQAPYNYGAGYDYDQPLGGGGAPPGRMILIAGALLLALCCAFSCGLFLGFEIIPTLLQATGGSGGTPVPTPRFTPTPQSLAPLIAWLFA